MPQLKRVSDGEGFNGIAVDAIKLNEDGTSEIIGHVPTIGCCLRVGSLIAGTYSARDFWTTTPILEFIKETEVNKEYYLKFRTENSVYEFWGTKQ